MCVVTLGAILLSACATHSRSISEPTEGPSPIRQTVSPSGTALPVEYIEDRFVVTPELLSGERLRLYTDTGGGLFIFESAARRAGLTTTSTMEDGQQLLVAPFPRFVEGKSIPPPIKSSEIPVMPPKGDQTPGPMRTFDGMLGQMWFAGRVWIFDYHNQQLIYHGESPPRNPRGTPAKLGFQHNIVGVRQTNFPRIQIEVDGRTLDMLFDTGAMTELTDDAWRTIADGRAATRATSFITNSVFSEWQKNHPDWRIIEKAESSSGEAMIEVPQVTIASRTVGPVWFTRRADRNFHEYMSQWMDKRVEGAVGGNILRNFSITVDYPNAIAYFR